MTSLRSLPIWLSIVALLLVGPSAVSAQDKSEGRTKADSAKAEADPAKAEAIERDRTALQGGWALVSVEENGKARSESDFKDGRYVFLKDNILEMTGDKLNFEIDYEIDPTSNPKRINEYFQVKAKDGKRDELMIRGIYKLDGDTLILCTGSKERPAAFESKNGVLMELRREKQPPKQEAPPAAANPK